MLSTKQIYFVLNPIYLIGLLFVLLFSFCRNSDCDVTKCKLSLGGEAAVTVTSNVSGGKGTQITPDIIINSSITESSAVVKFSVVRIGSCHEVVGYGHTWSSSSATPRIGLDEFIDYEVDVNFNDEIITIMNGLTPNTKYWTRSWIAIEIHDCERKRIIYYNDKISEFTTL